MAMAMLAALLHWLPAPPTCKPHAPFHLLLSSVCHSQEVDEATAGVPLRLDATCNIKKHDPAALVSLQQPLDTGAHTSTTAAKPSAVSQLARHPYPSLPRIAPALTAVDLPSAGVHVAQRHRDMDGSQVRLQQGMTSWCFEHLWLKARRGEPRRPLPASKSDWATASHTQKPS